MFIPESATNGQVHDKITNYPNKTLHENQVRGAGMQSLHYQHPQSKLELVIV